jgi:hypothetical protein
MKRADKGQKSRGRFENVIRGITPSMDEVIGDLFRLKRHKIFQPKWQDDPDGALAFARRTLEIAAREAGAGLANNAGKDIEDWAKSHKLASKAARAIDAAVKHILGAYADARGGTSRKVTIDLLVSPLGRIYRMKADS